MVNSRPSSFLCEDILLIPDFREAVVLAGLLSKDTFDMRTDTRPMDKNGD